MRADPRIEQMPGRKFADPCALPGDPYPQTGIDPFLQCTAYRASTDAKALTEIDFSRNGVADR